MPASWASSIRLAVQPAQAEQLQSLVTDLREDPVEGRLVDETAAQDRLTFGHWLHGEVAEPRRPGRVEMAPQADFVLWHASGIPQACRVRVNRKVEHQAERRHLHVSGAQSRSSTSRGRIQKTGAPMAASKGA